MNEELIENLLKNPLLNLPVLGFFENYPLETIITHNQSMILLGTSDFKWAYLSVPEPNDMETLLQKLHFDTPYFANVEEWMVPILSQKSRIEWKLYTHRYYLPEDTIVEKTTRDWKELDPTLISFIFQNSGYKDYTSEAYIADRLSRDISAGIWIDNHLAGWGLTHDDGSLGFLNVLSEHRGKGIGEAVFRAMITLKMERNKPVFVNIEPQNKQSEALLKKLGFVYDRPVSWVKLT